MFTQFIERPLVWSSEGGGTGQATPLTSAAKSASGVSQPFDVTRYNTLMLEIILTGFTGGTTPGITFEYDHIDAAGNAIPFAKPGALTAAGKVLIQLGQNVPTAAPTIAGWTTAVFPDDFGFYGQIAWTVTGTPTAVAWTAYLFGK